MFDVITGSPGTGKHTVSRLLADMLDAPMIDLGRLAVDSGLAGADGTDTDALARIVNKPAQRTILVGHLAAHVVVPDMVANVVVLRRSPYELERVYQNRHYSRSKTLANLGAEILDVVASEAVTAFGHVEQIDVTGDTPEESVRKTYHAIEGHHHFDDIDWLSLVCQNQDISRFFELGMATPG